MIVEDACGLTAEAMVNVSIDVPELIVELEDSYEVSCNVPFTITPDWSGGEPYFNFAWLAAFRSWALTRTWIGHRFRHVSHPRSERWLWSICDGRN